MVKFEKHLTDRSLGIETGLIPKRESYQVENTLGWISNNLKKKNPNENKGKLHFSHVDSVRQW